MLLRRLALVAALSAGGWAISSAAAGGQTPAPELLPDLAPFRAGELEVTGSRTGARRLRLTTSIVNAGRGPVEIAPARGNDCNGNGRLADDQVARQRIYLDGNADGRFDRLDDDTTIVRDAGCMAFHASHDHWHFEDFALYQLVHEATGRVVASSTKVSFCVEDLDVIAARLPGKARHEYYDDCDPYHPQGISVGWYDTYTADLPGQFIPLRAVRDGRYCVRITADSANRLRETREDNNRSEVAIVLQGRRARPVSLRCRPPIVR